MSKFKKGDYIIHRNIGSAIWKIVGYENEYIKVVGIQKVPKGRRNMGYKSMLISRPALYRQALNIDYIHTLPTEQMAKFLWRYRIEHCDFCEHGFKATGDKCKHKGSCYVASIQWLQNPYDGWEVKE